LIFILTFFCTKKKKKFTNFKFLKVCKFFEFFLNEIFKKKIFHFYFLFFQLKTKLFEKK
jgi:hypothetical protein